MAKKAASQPTRRRAAVGDNSDGELTPLEFMLRTLRDENAAPEDRRWAAQQALPYMHPRLSTVAHSGDVLLRHEDVLDDLE